ncbi:MAG: DJ-1/PfpI family protein [Mycobacterium sp.]
MKIAILIFDRLTALDAVGPYEVLSRLPGAELEFVALEPGPKRTDTGALALIADRSLAEVAAPDILLIGGGEGNRPLMEDEAVLDWVRAAHAASTWTTSVCTGSLVLGAAGILDRVRATTHWAFRDRLAELGAEVVTDRVVFDGKIVTAAGVSAGIDLGLWLFGQICGDAKAKAVQLVIEYDPQPPYDSGHMSKASAATKATASALLTLDTVKHGQLIPSVQLLWNAAIQRVRSRKSNKRDRQAISA